MNNIALITNIKLIVTILIALAFGLSGQTASASEGEKHQTIEIEAENNKNVEVKVSTGDGEMKVFSFDAETLNDLAQLEFELSELDRDTQKTVIDVLRGVHEREVHDAMEKAVNRVKEVRILKNRDMNDLEFEGKRVFEHDMDIVKIVGASTAEAIVSMIEEGDFTAEQLEQIQAAIDAKK